MEPTQPGRPEYDSSSIDTSTANNIPGSSPTLVPAEPSPSEPQTIKQEAATSDSFASATPAADTPAFTPVVGGESVSGISRKRPFVKYTLFAFLPVLLIGVATVFAAVPSTRFWQTTKQTNNPAVAHVDIKRKYDSPIGLLPPFQESAVKAGKFKISGGAFPVDAGREGTFFVDTDGAVKFEMLPDDAKVNKLIKYLYDKNGETVKYYGADRNFTYDFQTLAGYHQFYSKEPSLFGNFVADVEAAKEGTATQDQKSVLTMGTECDSALASLQQNTTASRLNTKDLGFSATYAGNTTTLTANAHVLSDADRSVVGFFDNCFKFPDRSLVDYSDMLQKIKSHHSSLPSLSYQKKGDHWQLQIGSLDSDYALGGLKIEVWDINKSKGEPTGSTGSFMDRANRFGLTYSACRVVPVVTTAVGYSAKFVAENITYMPPTEFDSGYFCTTGEIPDGYHFSTFAVLAYDKVGSVTVSADEDLKGLRVFHDMTYEIEQYRVNHKNYPSKADVAGFTANLSDISLTAQSMLASKRLQYEPNPSDCRSKCTSYKLSYYLTPTLPLYHNGY